MKKFELTTRGHTSSDFNIKCIKHNGYSGVGKSYKEIEIQGRDFPLIVDNNTRERFKLEVEIVINSENLYEDILKIKEWLLCDIEDKKIELSDMGEYYFLGFLDNKIDIEDILAQLGMCTLNFNCQPFVRLANGDNYFPVADTEGKLRNPTSVISRPLIKISSNGDVQFSINDEVIELKNTNGIIYIDSELMDTYSYNENGVIIPQNHLMYSDFPILNTGTNTIKLLSDNINSFYIMPRWRNL